MQGKRSTLHGSLAPTACTKSNCRKRRILMASPVCRVCGTELSEENWYLCRKEGNSYICKGCEIEHAYLWQKKKRGIRPFNENRECPVFLGVHVAERVLSHIFKNVEKMPYGHPGYDFICNRGKKIDVKSSCLRKKVEVWSFHIERNTTADYFLCMAFDNRKDLNPMHIWLIPGSKLSHLVAAAIRPNTTSRWNEYELDISKVITCCDVLKL